MMFKRKGGKGVKGLLNNVKKNCTFLTRWLPLPGQALRSTQREQIGFSVTDLYLGVLLRTHYRSSQRQEAHTFLKDFA